MREDFLPAILFIIGVILFLTIKFSSSDLELGDITGRIIMQPQKDVEKVIISESSNSDDTSKGLRTCCSIIDEERGIEKTCYAVGKFDCKRCSKVC
ncbi:MAG: hypothetical protein KJ583_01035 [Nanoarchaeota archaeon]|nr:hypothetical protein [Nanoarchaeota archaeon]MBU1270497.1 hypothetical protein [Nanoarchaeota archaeon]MBU1603875.1 hypothetical protein [Nanoarchaeota archaeon]MBU2442726.1 hypothetical protein [Nanoarchaeota archaeon]